MTCQLLTPDLNTGKVRIRRKHMERLEERRWKADVLAASIVDERGREVLTVANMPDAEVSDVLHLAAAAPDMARALLAHGHFATEPNGDADVWRSERCWATGRATCTPDCKQSRDALTKAGVLP
jgi:hypothetical protein